MFRVSGRVGSGWTKEDDVKKWVYLLRFGSYPEE